MYRAKLIVCQEEKDIAWDSTPSATFSERMNSFIRLRRRAEDHGFTRGAPWKRGVQSGTPVHPERFRKNWACVVR